MSLGLGTLTELKKHVLAESLRTGTDFDTALSSIGSGVAVAFDKHCNRTFARGSGVSETIGANRDFYYVRRYPIESVTSLEILSNDSDGWQTLAVADAINNTVNEIGRLYFGFEHGQWYEQLRVTYTGGYWVDQTEQGTDTLPTGATALPADIKLAWLTQCQHAFNQRDRLGASIGRPADPAAALNTYELIPEVKRMLDHRI